MLSRILFAFLLILACAASAYGQSTVTSGTILDANGQAFAGGTYNITFNPNGHVQPFQWNGAPFTPQTYAGALDNTGSFSGISIPSTNAISPSGTLWRVTVCPLASSPCYSTNVALQGTSLNIGSQITPPAITVSASDYNQPTAYSDGEINGAKVGFLYFNLTDQTIHECTIAVPCTWVSVAPGTPNTIKVDGTAVPNANLQDSSSYAYSVSGSNIQLLPRYMEVGPVGLSNGNFVAPTFYPTAGSGTPPNPPQGWSLDANTTLSYDQTTAPANNEFSVKLTCITSANECGMNNMVLQTLTPGQTYLATGWVRGDGTVGTQLAWEFERSADPVGDLACFSPPITSTTWTFVSVSCTAGNQDNGFVFVTQNSDGPSTAGNMWVQDVQVFPNTSQPLDITVFGARCDGTSNDATPIQNALTAANLIGGSIFSPRGRTCIIASQVVLDNFVNVSVLGGFSPVALPGNTESTWKFTGTCAAGACLSMKSTTAVNIYNIELWCSGMTTSPCVDLSHSSSNADSSLGGFHGVAFNGPGTGTLVLDQNTDYITFDDKSSFYNASVFVQGPVNNAALYTDSTVLDSVLFGSPVVAAIENPSVNWKFKNINAALGSGASCVPLILYVNSYTNEQQLSITDSTLAPGQTAPCSNAFNIVNLPPVTGNLGGLVFDNNTVLIDTGSTGGNVISAGNGQTFSASDNLLQNPQIDFVVGTGVTVRVGPNNYSGSGSLFSGTPVGGYAIDPNGIMHLYSPLLASGAQAGLSGTGACATRSSPLGAWAGKVTCTGTTGASTLVLTPATSAPNGLSCFGSDTTAGTALAQSGTSTTTCTLSGTITANDVLTWSLGQF
jgi:hypothetical protein